mmetsp:Transcript_86439/g.180975  ORF Transcript_86439/g.180975 Transcript_86439/m.180975 type:complete len:87 (+) Transcript_86439:173-433(+)
MRGRASLSGLQRGGVERLDWSWRDYSGSTPLLESLKPSALVGPSWGEGGEECRGVAVAVERETVQECRRKADPNKPRLGSREFAME